MWVRNFREGPRWVRGVVLEILGPLTYLVQTLDGVQWKRHLDQIREGAVVSEPDRMEDQDCEIAGPGGVVPSTPQAQLPSSEPVDCGPPTAVCSSPSSPSNPPFEHSSRNESSRLQWYPSRNRQPPDRLYGTLQS